MTPNLMFANENQWIHNESRRMLMNIWTMNRKHHTAVKRTRPRIRNRMRDMPMKTLQKCHFLDYESKICGDYTRLYWNHKSYSYININAQSTVAHTGGPGILVFWYLSKMSLQNAKKERKRGKKLCVHTVTTNYR